MTNDYEPRTIVYSCFDLMRQYYMVDHSVSFGFVAAADIDPAKAHKSGNRRFRFYRTLALNYFGTKTFVHLHDGQERLYLLLNKQQLQTGQFSVSDVAKNINDIYEGDFNFSWD